MRLRPLAMRKTQTPCQIHAEITLRLTTAILITSHIVVLVIFSYSTEMARSTLTVTVRNNSFARAYGKLLNATKCNHSEEACVHMSVMAIAR